MLVELGLVEQRHKAVCEVLDGTTVVDVAQRNGVTRPCMPGSGALPTAAWAPWPTRAPSPRPARTRCTPRSKPGCSRRGRQLS